MSCFLDMPLYYPFYYKPCLIFFLSFLSSSSINSLSPLLLKLLLLRSLMTFKDAAPDKAQCATLFARLGHRD